MSKKLLSAGAALLVVVAGAAVAPAASAAPTALPPAATARADIDGDGRVDRVTLALVARKDWQNFYRLTVTPAKGRAASTGFSLENDAADLTPRQLLRGTGAIDGVKGSEVVVLQAGGGESAWDVTYTWRAGKLAVLHAPGGVGGWNTGTPDMKEVHGQSVGAVKGARTVTIHDLHSLRGGWAGTSTTYTWRGSRWVKTSVTDRRRLTDAQALKFNGWIGVKGLS